MEEITSSLFITNQAFHAESMILPCLNHEFVQQTSTVYTVMNIFCIRMMEVTPASHVQ